MTPTDPTTAGKMPTPTPRTDAVNECAKRLILNRPFGSSTADLLQELADLYSKHAESLERFLGSALANNDPLREKVIEFQRELAAKDAMIAALEKDKALLDEFESLCRCDDVQAHQISEDECERELLGHYWGTPTVQSCSVREAMKAALEAYAKSKEAAK